MMSSDREILLDIQGSIYKLNTRLDRVESDVAELKTGLQKTNTSVKLLTQTVQHMDERLSARISDLQTFFYYGLVIIGVLIAFTTFVITSFSFLRREESEGRSRRLTDYEIENMINNKINQVLKNNTAG